MKKMIALFKALSDRNRLRVLAALTTHKELCACQITELLQVAGATTSRHLGILISAGLLESRKEGRWVYYRLNPLNTESAQVMDMIRSEFEKSGAVLKDLRALEEITACSPEILCRKQRGKECCPNESQS